MYNDEIVNEVKNSNDIVDIISQYVVLKRSGKNYFGLCPFHSEKSPSFSVSPDKQIFHCFGCGIGGDVIHFVSKIENINFYEALRVLADRAKIQLPVSNIELNNDEIQLKEKIYEINKIVADFYHQNLYQKTSRVAQEYVKKRKLDNKTLKEFQIGYSGDYNEVHKILQKKGFSQEEIMQSALVKKSQSGKYMDTFRKRLMFPIKDLQGRIIAFGGRVLDDTKPKYINSPETKVYSKSRNLFGIYNAKKNSPEEIIIVEGYMDVISLYQRGITNVVASLGTALTEAQGRLLRRFSNKVIIGYDSDSAGQNATMRGLEILQKLGCDMRILQLEGAKDPDEFVLKYGTEYFKKFIEKSISLVEFKVKILKKELNLESANDKIKFLKEIAKVLSKINNNIEQEVYMEKIADVYKISKEAIEAEVLKLADSKTTGIKTLERRIIVKKENEDKIEVNEATKRREKMIIYLLLNFSEQSFKKIKHITVDEIKINKNKEIIQIIYGELNNPNGNINNILNRLEENQVDYITEIMAEDFEIVDVNKCIDEILISYEKEKYINLRNQIVKQLQKPDDLSKDEIAELENELNEIILKLAKIK